MHEIVAGSALAEQLTSSSIALTALADQVETEGHGARRVELSGWRGPASWACQLSLHLFEVEVAAAVDLIRAAASLTQTAAWEVRARG